MNISATGWAKIGTLAAVALYLGGCSEAYEPIPHVSDVKAEKLITSTASLTHTIVLDRKTPFVTCTMPAPDAAFAQKEQANFSFALIAVGGNRESDSGGEEEGSSEDELAGRTPAVLMTRELFFRLCEFSRNYGLNKAEALKLYRETLTTVKGVWEKEAGNTTVKVGDAVTTIINNAAGDQNQKLPSGVNVLDGSTSSSGTSSSSSSTGSTTTTSPFGSTTTTNPSGN